MDKERSRAAKAHLVAQMQEGQPWRVAKASAGVQTSQSTAYRLLHVVRKQGEIALQDGRHGHPVKLRGAARTFLEDYCRQTPSTPSPTIQTLLQERFGLSISTSQINRVRATLGVSNCRGSQEQEKKRE